jgi:ABC-type amino acid transport substrate-binding protein
MRKRTIFALLGAVLVAVLVVGAATGCGSKKSSGKAPITIQIFPADTNAAAALLAGKVDAYFADATPVLYYIKQTGGKFEIAGKQIATAPEGIATRKGDPLGAKFKQAIAKLYANGEMQKILAKWGLTQFALKGNAGSATTTSSPNPGGTVTFCSDTTYPPMESLVGGKPVGADVDIANPIAKLWGEKAHIKTTGFDVLTPALIAKRCDAVISAMTDNPDRAKKVDFADYITVGMLLMVNKGNPSNISDLASLSGKTVAVEAATTEKAALDAENKILAKAKK